MYDVIVAAMDSHAGRPFHPSRPLGRSPQQRVLRRGSILQVLIEWCVEECTVCVCVLRMCMCIADGPTSRRWSKRRPRMDGPDWTPLPPRRSRWSSCALLVFGGASILSFARPRISVPTPEDGGIGRYLVRVWGTPSASWLGATCLGLFHDAPSLRASSCLSPEPSRGNLESLGMDRQPRGEGRGRRLVSIGVRIAALGPLRLPKRGKARFDIRACPRTPRALSR